VATLPGPRSYDQRVSHVCRQAHGDAVVVDSGVVVVGSVVVVVGANVVVVEGSAVVDVLVELDVDVVGAVVGGDVLDEVVGALVVTGAVGVVVTCGEVVPGAVVVVGGGRAGSPMPGEGTVVAKGPPMVVVVMPDSVAGAVVPGNPGSPGSVRCSSTVDWLGVAAGDRPVSQSTPRKITPTSAAVATRTMTPERRRPTTTLLRRENRRLVGAVSARRAAIRLARSSGSSLPGPLGRGNEVPFPVRRPVGSTA